MDRKSKELRGTTEERPDGIPAFQAVPSPGLHRVLGKERRNALRVVLVIAIRRISRLEMTDGVHVFQGLHPLFELCQASHIDVLWFRPWISPR